jgi:hypothetical protein
LGTFPPWVRELIDQWRPDENGWGAITLRAELLQQAQARPSDVPSVKTIANYLHRAGRTRPYRKGNGLPDTTMIIGESAHEVWQMDAEGNKTIAELGRVSFINIKDTYSKVYAQALPKWCQARQSHASLADYQLALRLAWTEFGMNQRLQVDHESIYYDNTHLNPYPTKMHLWLLGMGVQMVFTPKGKPYRQGAAERSHQTLHRQICHHHGCETQQQFLQRCQQRRRALNEYIPCRMLGDQSPLQKYPEARKSKRLYKMEQEKEIYRKQLALNYLEQCPGWQRKIDANHCIQIGGHRYYLSGSKTGVEVQIQVHAQKGTVQIRHPGQNQLTWELPVRGIDFKDLAGTLKEQIKWRDQNQVALGYQNQK